MKATSLVAACHSAACAPPPAGRGGSVSVGHQVAYVKDMLKRRTNTTVTRDGKIAVTNGGGKTPRFHERSGKNAPWRADRKMTKESGARVRDLLAQAVSG